MRLRELLTAARAVGWTHVIYSGSFGTEHTWQRDNLGVGLEPRINWNGGTYHLLTIYKDGTQLVAGRVDSIDQVVHLLAAYGLINCPHREKLARVQDGYAQINHAVADAYADISTRWLDLHANNGVPIGGASCT